MDTDVKDIQLYIYNNKDANAKNIKYINTRDIRNIRDIKDTDAKDV